MEYLVATTLGPGLLVVASTQAVLLATPVVVQ